MSQLKEILSIEQERSSLEQCAVIHLFREGTFYRAYEWSAWLCQRYFTELKVTHRLLKGGEDIVFVGFLRPVSHSRSTTLHNLAKKHGSCFGIFM